MGMSDRIESFILELLKQEQNDWLTIQRNEMAQLFGCVPSQINYVLQTRFSPERGYVVDSKRGGGGCVRIRRVPMNGDMPTAIYIKSSLTEADAREIIQYLFEEKNITEEQARLTAAAVSDKALINADSRDTVRSNILKQCLITVLNN